MPRITAALLLGPLLAWPCWAKFPNVYPYIDQCSGVDVTSCNTDTKDGQCQWFTDQYPWCFDRRYATLQVRLRNPAGSDAQLTTANT